MSDIVKVALIIAGTAIICTAAVIFFSPYHTCLRTTDWDARQCLFR